MNVFAKAPQGLQGSRLQWMKSGIRGFAILAALASASFAARAETFPSRNIRLVVPFAAGGTVDLFARLVAVEMGKSLGQSVVVENVPGAGGVIGTTNVSRSAPDGYSLCFCASGSTMLLPLMDSKVSYKIPEDLPPVGHVLRIEQTIIVNTKKGPNDLASLVAKAKANPGMLFYATPGLGTSNHLAGELLKIAAKIDVRAVHYRGESAAVLDLLSGQLDYMVASMSFAEPYSRAGELQVLALTGPSRWPNNADIPTIAESGYPGFDATTQVGLHASKGTPRDRIEVINAAMNKALQNEELRAKFALGGATPQGGTVDDYAKFLQAETAKWDKVVQQAGIKLD